jgi:hypothetical protein
MSPGITARSRRSHCSQRETPRQSTRLLVAIRELGQAGRGDFKKLQGADEWRLRVGDWRVLFILRANAAYVSRITDRQDAY